MVEAGSTCASGSRISAEVPHIPAASATAHIRSAPRACTTSFVPDPPRRLHAGPTVVTSEERSGLGETAGYAGGDRVSTEAGGCRWPTHPVPAGGVAVGPAPTAV